MGTLMRIHERDAVKSGGSMRIALPLEWVRTEGVTPGQNMEILETDLLVILPPRELKDEEIEESFECVRRMIKVCYRNRNARKT